MAKKDKREVTVSYFSRHCGLDPQPPQERRKIAREKQLKNWKREWKNALVNEDNPAWNDLSESIGVTGELVESIKAHSRRHSGFCQDPPTQKEIAGQARNDGIKRGIKPEELPPDEVRKKLERRVATEEKAIEKSTQKQPKSLNKQ